MNNDEFGLAMKNHSEYLEHLYCMDYDWIKCCRSCHGEYEDGGGFAQGPTEYESPRGTILFGVCCGITLTRADFVRAFWEKRKKANERQ